MSAFKLTAVLMFTLWTATLMSNVDLAPRERLGRLLFFDETLSAQGNQSCATCHDPQTGWVGAKQTFNLAGGVYEGSISGRFGNRKPPSAAYATLAPKLGLMHPPHSEFIGGNFWDGRATGEKLGNPAADQAVGPFLNPVEHALTDARSLVEKVCGGNYAALFKEVWGAEACDDVDKAYGYIGLSIAAYEGSAEVNQFSSKFDAFLARKVDLTERERHGLGLFTGKARCAQCHPLHRGRDNTPPLFTDFGYENIGIPRNPANPFYANVTDNPMDDGWIDQGLGGFLATTSEYASYAGGQLGKHKVPTLRNVDLRPSPDFVKAYGHNGYFKSLKEIVHFYNTRDLIPRCTTPAQKPGIECWPAPEVPVNVNRNAMGRLGLTVAEEDAIVAFLATLSDGYRPR